MKRKSFLAAGASGVALASVLPAAGATLVANPLIAGRKALVLSGGGSFGSYQAGVVQALVEQQGVHDGQPLDFDMVCGTSIGGLGGYCVATAQYSGLRSLWRDVIATQRVAQIKAPYDKIRDPNAGVLTRLAAAISLGIGAGNGLQGVLDNTGFHNVIEHYIDPSQPVHLPLYIATTNLTRQLGRLFVRKATTPEGLKKQAINDELLVDFRDGREMIRVIDDAILRDVLYSTAAIPVAFDPGLIPNEDGNGSDQYVDGGVTANIPIGAARRCVDHLYAVLVDPPPSGKGTKYDSLLEISLGVFGTMQRRILEYQILLAYAQATKGAPFDPFLIRPAEALAGSFVLFDDQKDLTENYDRGYQDGRSGWQAFVPPPGLNVN
jgi:predicted acylesterase/phospholipase RssA